MVGGGGKKRGGKEREENSGAWKETDCGGHIS